MKIGNITVLQKLEPFEINRTFKKVTTVVDGRVGIGTLTGVDRNWDGILLSHTFGAANVEESLTHNLRTIPIGFLTITSSNGGVIYDGVTRSTTSVLRIARKLLAAIGRKSLIPPLCRQ